MSLRRFLLTRLGRLAAAPIHRRIARFARDCEHPERVQRELLLRIVTRQAGTGFGRDHGFGDVRTVADFRRHVPIAPYEAIAPYIEREANGERGALIAPPDRVRLFALTSGTTAARKLIPVTDAYLRAYRRGWNMWGARAYRDHRGRGLFLRAIVQMVGDPDEYRTPAGVPCGNLTGFTAVHQKWFIRRLYAVPPECGKIGDPVARYHVALRFALPRDCSLFLAANPSTLIALGRTLDARKEQLLRDVQDGTLDRSLDVPVAVRRALESRLKPHPDRARHLSAIADKLGRLFPMDVWRPERSLIGTWTGGSMGPYLRQVPTYFGRPVVRDLGLLASEGRMTVPFANDTPAGVLDIWSHYFEFVPEAEAESPNPVVLGAHELEDGRSYFLVPTTAAGLYRYQLSDLVRVRGFLGRTPLVEFLGKGRRFANLTGEKLSEPQVSQAMEAAGGSLSAYVLAPVWDDAAPYYGLFVEEPEAAGLDRLAATLDRELGERNVEYASKRQSGRLGPVRGRPVPAGFFARFDRDRLAATGGSPEQYKRPCLVGDLGFAANA
jgi:hypothetical protein